MKKFIWALMMVFSGITVFAQIPSGYYDDAEGLSGASLKTALYQIIDNHDVQTYASLWIHFESTDPKPNGKVWDMYSDVPGGNPPYEFNFGDDQCGNYGGEGDCYNREHSFPKSWFNDASPMYSDLFQIVPTDGYVNGKRSNFPYGEVGSASWTSMNGSKVGDNSTTGYSGVVFEPIDEYKGDFARIYFYMATRYENLIASWENNSTNADAALNGTAYPAYEEWYLNLLLDWHQNDPVDQKEIDRNNETYDIQDNRNPFVDHSEYVALVWGGVQAPIISNISYNPEFPNENEAVTVEANISDDGSISMANLQWGLTNTNLNNNVSMSGSGSSYSAQIPGQPAGQVVYFRIEATDNESNTSLSAIYNYQVSQNAGTIALPFTEDFNDETLGIFYEMSVSGPLEYWYNDDYDGSYYAKMSNYDGNNNIENEDWIITPAINFDAYSGEVLSFTSSMMDYSDNSTYIYLLYSTNYSGTGDPNNASWTNISSQANWSSGDYNWVPSGDISLAGISGGQVYIAFKYESQAGSGKTWQIDDVSISIDGGSNMPPSISNIQHTPLVPDENEVVNVNAQITDDDGITEAILFWGFSSANLSNSADMSNSGSDYTAQIPGQSEGVSIYYKVQATDTDGAVTNSDTYQYTVATPTNLPPTITNVVYDPLEPSAGEEVNVSAQITDDNNVETALVVWGYEAGNLSELVEMDESGNIYDADIPGQNEGVTVFFKIQAFDNEGAMSETGLFQYTVEVSSGSLALPFLESFENGDLGVFVDYSVTGVNEIWHNDDYDDNLYAKMSNYDGNNNLENEDWMITSAINFDNYTNEVLRFRSSMQNYDDNNTFLYLKISNNYDGVSNPNTANWTDLTSDAYWSAGDYDWVESGDVDLSNLQGNSVYLAFQYVSQDGSGKTWQVDNVSITLDGSGNMPPQISDISQTPEEPNNYDFVMVSATITDDQNLVYSELYYGTSPVQMTEIIPMNGNGDIYSGQIPQQNPGLTIYYRVKAEDDDGAISYSSIYNYYIDLAEGVSDIDQQQFFFYPNPANDYIQIVSEFVDDTDVLIIHSSGKKVLESKINKENRNLNISSLEAGYYLIQVFNNKGSST
ncbi:MAG: DUF5017 domain-containing protein, partial [Bacteroidales bacterium]|nr:DUF5017 domain-containing protein [Bacteroidales bacterium]